MTRVPAQPFRDWLESRIDFYEQKYMWGGEKLRDSGAARELAELLGVHPDCLKHWRRDKRPTFLLDTVEEALWRCDTFLWELYPELLEEAT